MTDDTMQVDPPTTVDKIEHEKLELNVPWVYGYKVAVLKPAEMKFTMERSKCIETENAFDEI